MGPDKSYGGRRHKGNLDDHDPLEPDYETKLRKYLDEFASKRGVKREGSTGKANPRSPGGEKKG